MAPPRQEAGCRKDGMVRACPATRTASGVLRFSAAAAGWRQRRQAVRFGLAPPLPIPCCASC